MKKRKHILLIAATALALVGCSEQTDKKEPLVEMNDVVITQDEFYKKLKTSVGEEVLRQMVLERLLKETYDVSDEEIQHEIKKVKIEQGFKSDAELNKALEENGVTLADFQENRRMKLLLDKASVDGVEISEEDVQAEYERIKGQVRASHILVSDRTTAQDVYQQLQDGANFEELAEQYSIDTASSVNGGDLGFFGEDYLIDALEKKAFSLNVGQISEPFETSYGFHILKVTEKNRSYEELKETIKKSLVEKQKKTTDEVFRDLVKNKNISIYDETLQNALK